jgi:hypothetical protein
LAADVDRDDPEDRDEPDATALMICRRNLLTSSWSARQKDAPVSRCAASSFMSWLTMIPIPD